MLIALVEHDRREHERRERRRDDAEQAQRDRVVVCHRGQTVVEQRVPHPQQDREDERYQRVRPDRVIAQGVARVGAQDHPQRRVHGVNRPASARDGRTS